MIKGWRNDPQWVAHYAVRDKERLEREIARLQVDMQLQQLHKATEDSIRRMGNPWNVNI